MESREKAHETQVGIVDSGNTRAVGPKVPELVLATIKTVRSKTFIPRGDSVVICDFDASVSRPSFMRVKSRDVVR